MFGDLRREEKVREQPTTIAILGADTVVGSALCALLGGSGYSVAPIDAHPTGVVDELLEGADLLLLAPRLDAGAREAFVGAIGASVRQRARVPVIALTTALEDALPEGQAESVPWPCERRAFLQRIEAVLAGAPPRLPHEGPDSIGAVTSGRLRAVASKDGGWGPIRDRARGVGPSAGRFSAPRNPGSKRYPTMGPGRSRQRPGRNR